MNRLYLPGEQIDVGEVPRLSPSIAAIIANQSPLHAWYQRFGGAPEEYSDAKDAGILMDRLTFGVGPEIVVVEAKDWRTKDAQEMRAKARTEKKLPVLEHKFHAAVKLATNISVKLEADHGIVLDGVSQPTLLWAAPLSGVPCIGRPDHWLERLATIFDLKFVASCAKKKCEAHILEFGADIQRTAYTEGIEQIYPDLAGRVNMKFIFVEREEPHTIRVMDFTGQLKQYGAWRWDRACVKWRECLEKFGKDTPWPAYDDLKEPADVPGWAMNEQFSQTMVEEITEWRP